jgi:hypothetical protein
VVGAGLGVVMTGLGFVVVTTGLGLGVLAKNRKTN